MGSIKYDGNKWLITLIVITLSGFRLVYYNSYLRSLMSIGELIFGSGFVFEDSRFVRKLSTSLFIDWAISNSLLLLFLLTLLLLLPLLLSPSVLCWSELLFLRKTKNWGTFHQQIFTAFVTKRQSVLRIRWTNITLIKRSSFLEPYKTLARSAPSSSRRPWRRRRFRNRTDFSIRTCGRASSRCWTAEWRTCWTSWWSSTSHSSNAGLRFS